MPAIYQQVIAGRVREDEFPFFKNNQFAVPGRVVSISNMGGAKQPFITKNYLQTPNVGKPMNDVPNLDVDVMPAYQTGVA